MTETKRCTKCGGTYLLSLFHKRDASARQVQSWCKMCYAEWQRDYRRTHRDDNAKRVKKWTEAAKKRAHLAQAKVTSKVCIGCQRTKKATDFYRLAGSTDGLREMCIACTQAKTGVKAQISSRAAFYDKLMTVARTLRKDD